MSILLAFAPFAAFALVERFIDPLAGLLAGTGVSLALVLREIVSGRAPKLMEIGGAILFGGLTLYSLAASDPLSIMGTRLLVDTGLLMIVLLSLAIGRPFTVQYAREQVPSSLWETPEFKRVNVVISAVWALVLAIIVAMDALLIFVPDISPRVGIAVIVAAVVFGVKFSSWYPKQQSAGHG